MSATAEKLAAEDRVYFPMRDKSLKDESGVYDIADVASPPLTTDRFISEEFYELEKQAIWKHTWLFLARESVIEKPGDYFLFDLHVLNASILVLRGRDGKVRAFYNTCAHRGSALCFPRKGNRKYLTCSFHGWVYDLEGSLVDVPQEERFPKGIDKAKINLKQISADVWGGFVFINMDPEPEVTLREYLKPMPDELGDYLQKEDWRWTLGYKRTFDTNWKTTVDVQAEGYHANQLHRKTVVARMQPENITAALYPTSKGVSYKIGPTVPTDGSYVPTPVAQLAFKYGASVYFNIGNKDDCKADKYPGAMNELGAEKLIFDEWQMFPNTCFFVQRDHVFVLRGWPLGPHKTQYEIDHYLIGEFETFKERWSNAQGLITLRDTLTEDMSTITGIHTSYRSGAFDVANAFTDMEVGVLAYQQKITDWIEAYQKKHSPTAIHR